jgi:hypothetical protein
MVMIFIGRREGRKRKKSCHKIYFKYILSLSRKRPKLSNEPRWKKKEPISTMPLMSLTLKAMVLSKTVT